MLRIRILTVFVLLIFACFPAPGHGKRITKIIVGKTLRNPKNVVVDGSGNVYCIGTGSDNAFMITPNGVITEIIDLTGDGTGNWFGSPSRMAVDDSGNA